MKVPGLSFFMMALQLLCALGLPALTALCVKRRFGWRWPPFLVGCLVFASLAMVLESTVHQLVLSGPLGAQITGNLLLYAVYGGAMAALFEELGRYFAFRTLLKKEPSNGAALIYGAGHGGIECFLILVSAGLNNLIYSVLINAGQTETITASLSGAQLEQFNAAVEALLATAPGVYLWALLERCSAIVLQLSLSVLVWFSVKKRPALLFAALGVHFLVDAATVLLAARLPTAAIEGCVLLLALLAAFFARGVWKKYTGNEEQNDAEH